MIEQQHPKLSVAQQCKLLGINRQAYYYQRQVSQEEEDVEDLKAILEVLNRMPFYGYRKVAVELIHQGYDHMTPKRVRRLMKRFGLRATYPGPNLSKARRNHKKYPYLLRGKQILYPNQVWASDITYIKIQGVQVYLAVIMDLYSRKVLSWRLSNSMDPAFCVSALQEALGIYGAPAIFNTDQGSQFTSVAFTGVLEAHQIEISMDGVGRALDNVYVERLWRSLKYEDIYLKDYQSMRELKLGLQRYFQFYNTERFHQGLDYQTPDQMYQSFVSEEALSLAG